jgi:beta-galactosidase
MKLKPGVFLQVFARRLTFKKQVACSGRMTARMFFLLLTVLLSQLLVRPDNIRASTFTIGSSDFLLDGKRFLIRCGEMHFARIPREYWEHRLKMAHAMGLNTVCAYLFWNTHEPEPGQFDFSGNADAAEFCRLAQREGLKVILRPGPYSCAEWDFGGFPYWLLKDADLKLRTQNAAYLKACERYLSTVGRQLAPLQITRGGPIIMVQVENEYGSYGNDRQYIGLLRDYLLAAGFEVPLFTCDGPSQLKNDTREDLFCVVNFGGNPESNFKALRQIRAQGPLMCGEYYPGWFDSWGKSHHTGDSSRIVKELGWMLEHNASFSIYMVHGGTSFGFTAGANCPPFAPQTTSYDYDAPISEAGWDTSKFHALRELFLQHLAPGETLPAIPAHEPSITIDRMELSEFSPLAMNLPAPRHDEHPRCMELCGQAHGCILYRTRLPAGAPALLKLTELHDYCLVFLDGKKIGTLDRRRNQNSIQLPTRTGPSGLDLLVDTFGHVNYGSYLHDRKGITEKVELVEGSGSKELTGWEVYSVPLDGSRLGSIKFEKGSTSLPAFYRTKFQLARAGDTFLDLSFWSKGVVWVNGHNLGRYWNIGPQQTLFCPGPWLKKGENELLVFELDGATNHTVAGLTLPVLNQVNETSSLVKHRKPGQNLVLAGSQPLVTGTFPPGSGWQTAKFPPTRGRYFCLEALNSQSGDSFTTCAELYLIGPDGKDLPRDAWKVFYADSEEVEGDDGKADNVFDLQSTTFWHTQWDGAQPVHPHQLVLDLGSVQTITGIRYLPRQESANGRIKDYRLYLRTEPFPLGTTTK